MWKAAVGNDALAKLIFQTALDLADAREGALFVVLRDAAASLPVLVAPGGEPFTGATQIAMGGISCALMTDRLADGACPGRRRRTDTR